MRTKLFITRRKTVSFDVDAQNGFTPICPFELPVLGGNEIVKECNDNAVRADYRYMSKDAHSAASVWVANEKKPQLSKVVGFPDVDVRWNQHCVVGTAGFELINGLPHPSQYNYIVYKGAEKDMHSYSPIYHDLAKKISTGVIEKARYDGIDTFILGGLALSLDEHPLCLGEAALDLNAAGFRVIVNLGATRSIGDASLFVEAAKEKGIKFVETANDIIDADNDDFPF